MTELGIRLLSLDGGGTRGLSALYTLREIMNGIAPDHGGDLRPNEYFDLIAGTGLNGLCALLFARFCYTVDEAISFFHDISQKLDDVVNFRDKVLRGDVEKDLQDWVDCMSEYNDPRQQLEALRQGMIQDCWSEVIEKNVSDGLDRYEHMENGKFDFKRISAHTEVGRCKVFVVSSESQGYGANGGVSPDNQYHVPKLHRTYECRHGETTYTLYAVGLGTVASPDIMKPGVIFPELLATGAHSQHNPTCLALEECRKLWPGLPVSTLLSIGVGTFDLERSYLEPAMEETAAACLQILEKNKELNSHLEQFVLPFDAELRRAYFRFENPYPNTFFEHAQRDRILGEIKTWAKTTTTETKIGMLCKALKSSRFPRSPEDSLALSSLASLLGALSTAGYAHEALTVSDILPSYLLYESSLDGDGSFRKLQIAAKVEALSSEVSSRHRIYTDHDIASTPAVRSEAAMLNGLITFDNNLAGKPGSPRPLETIYDYVSAIYYCLALLREQDESQLAHPAFAMHFQELCFIWDLPATSSPDILEAMEDLLELATLAALSDAATVQLLQGTRSLAYNGSFIRHLCNTLVGLHISENCQLITDPIATMLALLIEAKYWSPTSDGAILALLKSGGTVEDNWCLVNLALARLQMESSIQNTPSEVQNTLSKCTAIVELHCDAWKATAQTMIVKFVERGWFPLIRKSLCSQHLTSDDRLGQSADFANHSEVAFRSVVQAGYPFVLKTMLECLGMNFCKHLVNQPDERGLTSLHLACKNRAPKRVFRILQILLSDVNQRCKHGRTPLSYCFPDQTELPSLNRDILDMITEFSLPTIAPFDLPRAFGGHGNGKEIDPRTANFRVIVSNLICRNADISIEDNKGMTPLHHAVSNGWGDNSDVFFMYSHGGLNEQQVKVLTARDHENLTVLDYSRTTGNQGSKQGREHIIMAEMNKRAIFVPPKSTNTAPVYDIYLSMPLGRPRLPTPEPQPGNERRPRSTPSPQPNAPRFPPPLVYQDPSLNR
ncbi:hypothetical protein ONS95_014195 [Cadophora gregata]|uniref:uncharacterized protein n=1 Tax=Cadophora gregata TaxID=51156 RepID=UPI0026DD26A3|nr:uncharacterized protein ONS95_014195 [Cadophora gregata]KAK0113950.1 hypothetical protein ONS96_014799 [Cadophora gregata f. sp. sojae]KAK0114711.1 hypothetical protein ONS95_014195 [Cadophora gregata]